MSQSAVDRAAEHIAESAHQASCATGAIADAFSEGVDVVSRTARQGSDAAKEFLNDTTRRLRRNPGLTVAATFAVGLTAGVFLGCVIKRR
jgi:ElaB/YqjD/DUF883 family membrane-anchored ribosome-binding protein